VNINENSLKKPSLKFSKLQLLKNELERMATVYNVPRFGYITELNSDDFNPDIADSLTNYLNKMDKLFSKISNSASDRKDVFYNMNDIQLKRLEDRYYNYKLLEIVTKPYERKKILVNNNTLVQNIDPIYLDSYKKGALDFRTHFYAPVKYIFGIKTDTFVFNIILVLLSCVFFYFVLYFEVLGKTVRFIEKLQFRR
jgi:transcriptional regulator of aromatic amino acid metabolism